ncbi:nitroreductase/quinone reductase family protein [Jatrophihabitans fulvus]
MRSSWRVRTPRSRAWLPPRRVVLMFWRAHRAVVRRSHGRRGLWPPGAQRWGALQLTTLGRRSGQPRAVVLAYLEDGPNLVTMAMTGWAEPEPAWWLNLQAHPHAMVRTRDGARTVHARAAHGEERGRLWARFAALDRKLDEYAVRRQRETAVVVLEPFAG